MMLIDKINPKREISIKNISSTGLLFLSLVIVFGTFMILSPYFLTFKNIMNLLQYSSILGLAACGATITIISGSLDLSIGSIVAVVSVYVARLLTWSKGGIAVTLVGGIAIGMVCGLVNALLVTKVNIQPMIATLATMTIIRGVAYTETNAMSIGIFNTGFKTIGQGTLLSIPNMVWILMVVYLLFAWILKYTTFGRKVLAVGGNPKTSHLSGINVKRTHFLVFLMAGILYGLSGTLFASLTGTGSPSSNGDLGLEAISAAVLGGVSVKGGKGNIIGTALGVLILGAVSNGLVLINMGAYLQMIIKGCILIAAVALDAIRNRKVI